MSSVKQAVKILLHKAFDIREGEYRTAILMQMNIFLLISTLLIVKPNINALFLTKFGAERLPQAFVFVAFSALLLNDIYVRLLNKTTFNRIIERTLLVSFAMLVSFGILLRIDIFEGLILYLFYIWVSVFALLATSQFWVLSNMVYNIREAKRLFSFIGIGAIGGGIFGGYLTSVLAPVIGSENVLFVSAVLLLACIPITQLIWKENVSSLSIFRRKKRLQDPGKNPIRTIMSSKHLMYLAGMVGISVIVAKFVDYQFSDIAQRNIANPDDLAAFFGFWFSNLNLFSLAIQLFLTPRIVGMWGIGTSLLFLPVAILIGAVGILLFPGLATAILIKTADGSFKQSINKSATELLGLPIPLEIKNKAKTFIDVVVDSLATGIAGFILIFIVNGLGLSARFLSIAIILLIGYWLYLAYRVQKEYVKSFKAELRASDEATVSLSLPASKSILEGIETILTSGTENQILYMLDKIREIEHEHLFEVVQKLLNHDSFRVRAETIRTLYLFRNHPMPERIKSFIDDPSPDVKLAAFEYLFEHSEKQATEMLNTYLDHPDKDIANAALLCLAIETRNNHTLKSVYNLEDRIQQRIGILESAAADEARQRDKIVLIEVLGFAIIPRFYSYLSKGMKDRNKEVVRAAITAAGRTLDPGFILPITDFLGNELFQESARQALVNFGPPVIDRLQEIIAERKFTGESLHQIPSVIEQFRTQQAVNVLLELLHDKDLELRLEAVHSLKNLKVVSRGLKFHKKRIVQNILEEGQLYLGTLSAMYAQIIINFRKKKRKDRGRQNEEKARLYLIELLEQRLDKDLDRIFGLLDLKYNHEDIDMAYRGIRSESPEQRTNAIEYLDNLLEPDLIRVLIPIVETVVLDDISENVLRSLSLDIPSEKECFEVLLSSNDGRIRQAVIELIKQLDDEKYLPMVKKFTKRSELASD